MPEENDGDETENEIETPENRRELSLLAASHAAFDGDRRAARGDIIAESVLRVLNTSGPASLEQIRTDVARLWRTNSLSEVLIARAVEESHAAGLVLPQRDLLGHEQWTLSDEGRRDVQEDSAWASRTCDAFVTAAIDRLEDDPDRALLKEQRFVRMIDRVRHALAVGAEGMYDVRPGSSPANLRSVRYKERAALDALADVEPKAARRACERLLLGALNPDDPFGDDYLTLLAAGNILHGLITRRDLDAAPHLTGCRLALDTSTIVALASPPGALRRSLEEMIHVSRSLGVELIVPDHTIAEWGRLFAAADAEMGASSSVEGSLGILASLLGNPFVAAYEEAANVERGLTWKTYSDRWTDPREALAALGIHVRPHGNNRDVDAAFAEEMRLELRRLNRERGSADGPRRRLRRPEAIEADAQSAAMVARWRERLGNDLAFVVAHDRMTAEAYRALRTQDAVPLVVTPQAWLLLAASMVADDVTTQTEVAKIVGHAALRDSFLSLAACYTHEEVLEFSRSLCADDRPIEAADVAIFVQDVLDGFEDEANQSDRLAAARLRGAQVLQARAARRNQRARRAEAGVEETVREAVETERHRHALERQAEQLRSSRTEAELRERVNLQSGLVSARNTTIARLWRSLMVTPLAATAIIATILAWRAGSLDANYHKQILFLCLGITTVAAANFVRSGGLSALRWLGGVVGVSLVINVLSSLITK